MTTADGADGIEDQAADEPPADDPAAAVLAAAGDVVGAAVEADPDAWWMREDESTWDD